MARGHHRRSASPDLGRGPARALFPPASPSSPTHSSPAGRQPQPSPGRRGQAERQAPPTGWWWQQPDTAAPNDAFPAAFRDLQSRLEERAQAARVAGRPLGSLDPPPRATSPSRVPDPCPPSSAWSGGLHNRTRHAYLYETVVEVSSGVFSWGGRRYDEQGLRGLEDRWESEYGLVPDNLKEPAAVREGVTKAAETRTMVFDDLLLDPDLEPLQQQVPPELAGHPLNLRVDRYGNVVSDQCDKHALCNFEVDHVWPHSRRGRTEPGNLQALLWLSNRIKAEAIHNAFVRRSDGKLYLRRRGTGAIRNGHSRVRDPRRQQGPLPIVIEYVPLQCGVTTALLASLWEARLRSPLNGSEAARDVRFKHVLHVLLRCNWLVFAGDQPKHKDIADLLSSGADAILAQFYWKIEAFSNACASLQGVVPDTSAPPALLATAPSSEGSDTSSGVNAEEFDEDTEEEVPRTEDEAASLPTGSAPLQTPQGHFSEGPAPVQPAPLPAPAPPQASPLLPQPPRLPNPLPPFTRSVLAPPAADAAVEVQAAPLEGSGPLIGHTRVHPLPPLENAHAQEAERQGRMVGPPLASWWRRMFGCGLAGTGRVGASG